MRLNLPLSGCVLAAANRNGRHNIRVRRGDHLESIAHRTGYLPKRQKDGRRVVQGLLLNPSERALVLRIVGGAPQIVERLIQAQVSVPPHVLRALRRPECKRTTRGVADDDFNRYGIKVTGADSLIEDLKWHAFDLHVHADLREVSLDDKCHTFPEREVVGN